MEINNQCSFSKDRSFEQIYPAGVVFVLSDDLLRNEVMTSSLLRVTASYSLSIKYK